MCSCSNIDDDLKVLSIVFLIHITKVLVFVGGSFV